MAAEIKPAEAEAGEANVTARLGVRDRARQFSYIAKAGTATPKAVQTRQATTPAAQAAQETHPHVIETEIVDSDDYRPSMQLAVGTLNNEERVFLLAAVRCDYQVLAKALHENRQLVHVRCPFSGNSVMHFAAQKGNLDCIKLFAAAITQDSAAALAELVNSRNRSGMTSLHVASLAGQSDACELLSRTYKADIELRDYAGRRARTYQNVMQRRAVKALQRGLAPAPSVNDKTILQVSRTETQKRGTPATFTIVGSTATLPHNMNLQDTAHGAEKLPLRSGSTMRSRPPRGAVDRSTIVHVHNPDVGRVTTLGGTLLMATLAEDTLDSPAHVSPAPLDPEELVTPKIVRAQRPVALQSTPPTMQVEDNLVGAATLRQAREKRVSPKTAIIIEQPHMTVTEPVVTSVPIAPLHLDEEPLILRHDAMTLAVESTSNELAVRLSVAPVYVRPHEQDSQSDESHSTGDSIDSPSDPSTNQLGELASRSHALTDQPIAEEEEQSDSDAGATSEDLDNDAGASDDTKPTDSVATPDSAEAKDADAATTPDTGEALTTPESEEPQSVTATTPNKDETETVRNDKDNYNQPVARPLLRQRHSFANAFASDEDEERLETSNDTSLTTPQETTEILLHRHETEESEPAGNAEIANEQSSKRSGAQRKRIAEVERISALRTPADDASHSEHEKSEEPAKLDTDDRLDDSPTDVHHSEHEASPLDTSSGKEDMEESDDAGAASATDDEAHEYGVTFMRRERALETQSIQSGSNASGTLGLGQTSSATSSRSTFNTSGSSRRETNI